MRLELSENFGTVVSSKFKNFINQRFTGGDNTVCCWSMPSLNFDIYKEILTTDEVSYLLDFFIQNKGAKGVFQYRDPTDYRATIEPDIVGNNAWTQGQLYPAPDGIRTTFYLTKVYSIASNIYVFRQIFHPLIDTVSINLSGIGYQINSENGLVTFSSPPPASNYTITWSGKFDVAVSFETDTLPLKLITEDEDYSYYKLEKLRLIEQRKEGSFNIVSGVNQSLTDLPIFDFPIPFDTEIATTFKTLQFESDAGFVFKKSAMDNPLLSYSFANNTLLTKKDVDYLICFWRCRLGEAIAFKLSDLAGLLQTVRFNMNELVLTVTAEPNETERLFETDGLKFIQPLYNETSISFFCHVFEMRRTDGQEFYFTDFCNNLFLNDKIYHPLSGVNATATSAKLNEDRDNVSFASIVSDYITENDLLSGKWNEALLKVKICDWRTGELKTIFAGYLGELEVGYDQNSVRRFNFESLGIQNKLGQKWSVKTSYLCRHKFGDLSEGSCRYNFDHLIVSAQITQVSLNTQFRLNMSVEGTKGYYEKYGYILFTEGKNKNIKGLIKSISNTEIILWHSLPYLPSIGDTVQIFPGCAKSVEACQNYGNILNYGGFPLLPGSDILSVVKND